MKVNRAKTDNMFKRASEIYKKNPNKKWKTCLSEAGAQIRAEKKKIGYAPYTRKKMKQVSTVAKKIRTATGMSHKKSVAEVTIGSVPVALRAVGKAIAGKIGQLESKKFSEKRKLLKRKIQKEITALKKQYRKVS